MKKLLLTLTACFAFATSLKAYNHEIVAVHSKAMNKDIAVTVITPDSYAEGTNNYNVVYLLHGFGDNNETWTRLGKAAPHTDSHQLIFVCPDGEMSWYWDSPIDPSYRYETFVAKELIEWVDANYRTNASREGRAITGLSMGGHGALYISLRHQDTFGAAGSTSGGVDIRPFPDGWDMALRLGTVEERPENWENYTVINMLHLLPTDGSFKLIIDCGTEDFFYEVNCALHHALLERSIPHDFYVRPGQHNWNYWSNSIQYQLLFFSNYFKNN